MRLSLRTLLAFEDNVFDVEQHRRLEQLLPTDQAAETTLQRMRSVVRNPMLGVPGLVDQQEELDPNYVAEYLDHQMPSNVQEKFENYCLSADKYLAEIASVHHILSNVLGEPARTSRECRLKCYDALPAKRKNIEPENPALSNFEPLKHFRPYEPAQEQSPIKPESFWNRWFTKKTVPQAPVEQKSSSSLWTFTIIGLCVCVLLLGWQQIELKRNAQKLREVSEEFVQDDNDALLDAPLLVKLPDTADTPVEKPVELVASPPLEPIPSEPITPFAPIEQVSASLLAGESTIDPFAAFVESPPTEFIQEVPAHESAKTQVLDESETDTGFIYNTLGNTDEPVVTKSVAPEEPTLEPDDTIIAFQPVQSSAKMPAAVPLQQISRQPLPTTWHPVGESNVPKPFLPESTLPEQALSAPSLPESTLPEPSAPRPASMTAVQHPQPIRPVPQPITLTSGTAPQSFGRLLQMTQPSIVFVAASSEHPWQLPALPFELSAGQYLLTAAPFRGVFELAGSYRIEMIGDAKLCLLPPDASGVPGIFVDYGRIIIYPLQAHRPLRIEMYRGGGVVSSGGTESVLFIDTFAEINDASGRRRLPEEQRMKTSPIFGFIPKSGEQIVWQSYQQPQPFYVKTQGSVLLQSEQYRFGEIQNLPNWLQGPMPMSQEERMLAEVCRRTFNEARHGESDAIRIGAKALTRLSHDESQSVRLLGLRLWGDLGEFFVPLTVMAEKRSGDESVRLVLVRYFEEVMRRDAKSIQLLTNAIEQVREATGSERAERR